MPTPDPTHLRRTATDAAVFDERGRILLQRRSDFNVWGLPGGAIEVGETLVEAVQREVKEESGYDVEVIRLIGVYGDPNFTTTRYPSGDLVHYVSLTFECRVTGGELKMNEESNAMAWFDRTELPAEIFPDQLPRIRDAFAAEPITVIR